MSQFEFCLVTLKLTKILINFSKQTIYKQNTIAPKAFLMKEKV